jgi:hypothetical protein
VKCPHLAGGEHGAAAPPAPASVDSVPFRDANRAIGTPRRADG